MAQVVRGQVPSLVALGAIDGKRNYQVDDHKVKHPLVPIGVFSVVPTNYTDVALPSDENDGNDEWAWPYEMGYLFSALTSIALMVGVPTAHAYLKQFDTDSSWSIAYFPLAAAGGQVIESLLLVLLRCLKINLDSYIQCIYPIYCLLLATGSTLFWLALPLEEVQLLTWGSVIMGLVSGNRLFLVIFGRGKPGQKQGVKIVRNNTLVMQLAIVVALFVGAMCITFEQRVLWDDQISVESSMDPFDAIPWPPPPAPPPPATSPPPPTSPLQRQSLLGLWVTGLNLPHLVVAILALALLLVSLFPFVWPTAYKWEFVSQSTNVEDAKQNEKNERGLLGQAEASQLPDRQESYDDAETELIQAEISEMVAQSCTERAKHIASSFAMAVVVGIKLVACYQLERTRWGYSLGAVTLLGMLIELTGVLTMRADKWVVRNLLSPLSSSEDVRRWSFLRAMVWLLAGSMIMVIASCYEFNYEQRDASTVLFVFATVLLTAIARNLYATSISEIMRHGDNHFLISLSSILLQLGLGIGFVVASEKYVVYSFGGLTIFWGLLIVAVPLCETGCSQEKTSPTASA